jgi:hypothetical protein
MLMTALVNKPQDVCLDIILVVRNLKAREAEDGRVETAWAWREPVRFSLDSPPPSAACFVIGAVKPLRSFAMRVAYRKCSQRSEDRTPSLPDGKVFESGSNPDSQMYDPATKAFTSIKIRKH